MFGDDTEIDWTLWDERHAKQWLTVRTRRTLLYLHLINSQQFLSLLTRDILIRLLQGVQARVSLCLQEGVGVGGGGGCGGGLHPRVGGEAGQEPAVWLELEQWPAELIITLSSPSDYLGSPWVPQQITGRHVSLKLILLSLHALHDQIPPVPLMFRLGNGFTLSTSSIKLEIFLVVL